MKNSPYPHQFYTPEDFSDRTFFDAFADAFTHPEDLTLYEPDNAFMAQIRDAHNIRKYFEKAFGAEEKRQNNTSSK